MRFLFFFNPFGSYTNFSLEEGKQCIRNVPEWDEKFGKVINSHDCAPFTRLVALVAYHETCECSVPGLYSTHHYAVLLVSL